MKVWRVLKIVILTLFVGVALFIGISFFVLDRHLQKGCESIEKIARNTKSVAYLDNWASDHILNKGYHRVTGMHGEITASKGNQFISISHLPEESISGIERQYLRLNVNKISGDFETEITKENVGQLDFGSGRNRIIILKNGSKLSSYRGHDEASGHLLKINDSLYAYCADSKF